MRHAAQNNTVKNSKNKHAVILPTINFREEVLRTQSWPIIGLSHASIKKTKRKTKKVHLHWIKKACSPDWGRIHLTGKTGESCRQRWQRLYAKIAVMLSANTPVVPTHSATVPLPALNTSNSLQKLRYQHESRRHASSSSSPSGAGTTPFSCGSTFNFTFNLTLYVLYLVQEMNNNTIRTHPSSSKGAEFNYPVLLVIRHQLATTTTMVVCCQ